MSSACGGRGLRGPHHLQPRCRGRGFSGPSLSLLMHKPALWSCPIPLPCPQGVASREAGRLLGLSERGGWAGPMAPAARPGLSRCQWFPTANDLLAQILNVALSTLVQTGLFMAFCQGLLCSFYWLALVSTAVFLSLLLGSFDSLAH